MRPVMVLFAKVPVPGRVKTRLQVRLGPDGAARLHAAFVRDTLASLTTLATLADGELHTDEPTDAWSESGVPQRLQAAGDLGERLAAAITGGLAEGRPQVMVIGSDSPTLPAGHLRGLLASQADVALGPAEDGGYYAIACRRFTPALFHGVPWSSPLTLGATCEAARLNGLSVEQGAPWFDVDEPADLDRLMASPLPRHTRLCLQEMGLLPASSPPIRPAATGQESQP